MNNEVILLRRIKRQRKQCNHFLIGSLENLLTMTMIFSRFRAVRLLFAKSALSEKKSTRSRCLVLNHFEFEEHLEDICMHAEHVGF